MCIRDRVYNADSFNTGTEKKLADVLENLPGVEINEDGRVEVEGKEITKITVEGKDFFDGDSKLATQNLPAKAVGKVEVLRNFTEVGQLRNVTNNEDNIAINISLKSGKDKFWFGEILGGVGNEDRVLAAPKVFYYAKDFSMSVLGNTNNIGEPVLSRRDFYKFGGGFGNLNARNGTSISISTDGAGLGGLQNNQAKSIDAHEISNPIILEFLILDSSNAISAVPVAMSRMFFGFSLFASRNIFFLHLVSLPAEITRFNWSYSSEIESNIFSICFFLDP